MGPMYGGYGCFHMGTRSSSFLSGGGAITHGIRRRGRASLGRVEMGARAGWTSPVQPDVDTVYPTEARYVNLLLYVQP
ncbi:hypothetical protein GCM10007043_04270 [Calditerricola satsumensis]|uniref:Uncharacterized protein n=1 Tax=Calditerricola satsumensis TaxID=373054 RepID=A0A8J3BC55_9BACI|nr:hypothetical protein GCM10007043_04270 [Calditerricola satsumensis]